MKLGFVLATLLLSTIALAGDKGNIVREKGRYANITSGYKAGDSVICRDKKNYIKEAYLLEYIELDVLEENLVKFNTKIEDYEYIEQLAAVLENHSPDIFGGFRTIGRRLAKQAWGFLNNLPPTKLGVTILVPPYKVVVNNNKVNRARKTMDGCQIEPLIMSARGAYGMEYTINGDIFANLSQRDRRGMLVHEALYFSLQKYYGDEDSARTRFIHQRISQYHPTELTTAMLNEILTRAYLDFKI